MSVDRVHQYIAGKRYEGTGRDYFTTLNPATNEPLAEIQQATEDDVGKAVEAAEKGFQLWSGMSAKERSVILFKAAAILRERNEELAMLEVKDSGKPICEAVAVDILSGADVIEYYAGLVVAMHGEHQTLSSDQFFYTRREPLGVCAGIGAWNYPIQIACWKSGVALAAGNAMIFKPSEETPLTAMKLAEIYTEAGVPPGVFSVVQGAGAVGQMLTRHPRIAKVSFTGEVGTGKKVMADAASSLKEITMELGGKSPLLVFNDADIETAVNGAMVANFYTQGEVCTNGTRVFVQREIYPRFLASLKSKTEKLRVGDPTDPQTHLGALISKRHLEKVLGYIEQAKAAGATLLCGGTRVATSEATVNGNFVAPTIFVDCKDDMPNVKDEIFGPVMSVLVFDTQEEAILRANNTTYGLGAGVFTQNLQTAHQVVHNLQAGICWVNTWGDSPAEMPVGGYKLSGIGRENGPETLRLYTQTKSVFVSLSTYPSAFADLD
mmetsp:Transcript_20274/g.33936  ORF Transcript_20274/g.33936 Transcript_20274/m.33936 type:complete len:493 (+) Transcript_20274:57-1535(+)